MQLFFIFALLAAVCSAQPAICSAPNGNTVKMAPSVTNQCISFSVSSGTGCAWMCAHCADALGPSYYFTDGVCAYQGGGCVGNPLAGVTYTCCASAGAEAGAAVLKQ